jgi:hypothetical protein
VSGSASNEALTLNLGTSGGLRTDRSDNVICGGKRSAVETVVGDIGVTLSNAAGLAGSDRGANVGGKLTAISNVAVAFIEASRAVSSDLANTTLASNTWSNISESAAIVPTSVAVHRVSLEVNDTAFSWGIIAKGKARGAVNNLADTNVALLGESVRESTSVKATTAILNIAVGVNFTTSDVILVAISETRSTRDVAD